MNTENTTARETAAAFGYATMLGYTDRQAYEVIRRISDCTIEVRRLKATLLNGCNSGEPDALEFSPGGFAGHTSGVQRYSFAQDPEAPVVRIRRHKDGSWRSPRGSRFALSPEPREYYDFNF